MKDYDKNKESSYLKYWDVNILYGWAIFCMVDFKSVEETFEFNEDFIKGYNGESEFFLEVDVQYPENVRNLRNDLPVLPESMEIRKVEKFVANLHDKEKYVTHIRNL